MGRAFAFDPGAKWGAVALVLLDAVELAVEGAAGPQDAVAGEGEVLGGGAFSRLDVADLLGGVADLGGEGSALEAGGLADGPELGGEDGAGVIGIENRGHVKSCSSPGRSSFVKTSTD